MTRDLTETEEVVAYLASDLYHRVEPTGTDDHACSRPATRCLLTSSSSGQ